MADFQTIAGEFAVRVNDGMSWCVYHIRAATERDAHALAARLWGQREGHRVEHVKEPMPEPISGGAVLVEEVEAPKSPPKTSATTMSSGGSSATSANAGGSSTSATSGGPSTASATSGGLSTSSGTTTKPPEGGRTTSA